MHSVACRHAVRVLVPMPQVFRGTLIVWHGVDGRAGGMAWATA